MKTTEMASSFAFIGSRVVSFAMANDFVALNTHPHQVIADVSCKIVDISKTEDVLSGVIHLTVKSGVADSETNDKLNFELVLEGCFAAPEDTEPEKMEKHLIINGSALLYSTARAYIASVTALSLQSGKVALPTVNTFRLYEEYMANKATEQ